MTELRLTRNQYLEFEKLCLGTFLPVEEFMDEKVFTSVVNTMRLPSGEPFPLPIFLDIDKKAANHIKGKSEVSLIYNDVEVGTLIPKSFFDCDRKEVSIKLFGTNDLNHPGVFHFNNTKDIFVGGPIKLKTRVTIDISKFELTPMETKEFFVAQGWKTIVGFQTRNVPHRAHEYLQRVALEQVDGLLIQPLVGRKKKGDYAPEAIMAGYKALIAEYYPENRVLLAILSTAMRYAGPREAVFHAIIRRNYGCTHFIVGRDHAGVGKYYEKYEAHSLSEQFDDELGIKIMRLHGPYYCSKCDGIVTEHTCQHEKTAKSVISHISGTDMRAMLLGGQTPNANFMRKEVIDAVKDMPLFVDESEA